MSDRTSISVAVRPRTMLLSFKMLTLMLCTFSLSLPAEEFDHEYTNFGRLLTDVVVMSTDKNQSRVNYSLLAEQKSRLQMALDSLSLVSKEQYESWNEQQQLSFLINAYNGFTLQLIVNNWPQFAAGEAQSIRDLGGFFSTPWEQRFFTLFSTEHHLDDIEHQMIRTWFKEPRIHAALVCAAVSCPPLRNEPFVAGQLAEQLDDQMHRFLADNSRNEMIVTDGQAVASLSPIFDWYREDFEQGHLGLHSLFDLLNVYSAALIENDSNHQAQQKAVEKRDYSIKFKQYNWNLNDLDSF